VTVLNGTEIDITLQTIGPESYGSPEITGPAVDFVSEADSGFTPGGPTQLFRFDAVVSGQTHITVPFLGSYVVVGPVGSPEPVSSGPFEIVVNVE